MRLIVKKTTTLLALNLAAFIAHVILIIPGLIKQVGMGPCPYIYHLDRSSEKKRKGRNKVHIKLPR